MSSKVQQARAAHAAATARKQATAPAPKKPAKGKKAKS